MPDYSFHDSHGNPVSLGDTLVADNGRFFKVDENLLRDSVIFMAGYRPIYGLKNGRGDDGKLSVNLVLDAKQKDLDGFPVIMSYIKLRVKK